ncbi:uncharacterized protein BROUX77_005253 [Berkeleyomyces rouxiae]|uniref:uncharacterized protein n=1 Tax=Berkeleyomyces rouxiae TaxID=2035830 RepID=UPI003B784180
MGNLTTESDPIWADLDWAMGQMLIMGWDGTEVTPQIRRLIAEKHLGSIILTAKNLKSAHQTAKLVQELQMIAKQSGHPQPLLIALDQENGGVNSLFDDDYVCQFPSAMGIGATGRSELAYEVTKATATEIAACGINLMLGPVLDVLSNARYQPLGVRATSDDPQEVSEYANAAIRGIKDAGIACCGKHFPSYGNLDFGGSNLDIPIITQTLEELSLSALIPFRNAIATGNLDAMFVGGCGISNPSLNVQHACLSDQVVDYLLRNELKFNGVAISECLEMEALSHEIGVQNGVVMAVEAGCDLVLLCRAYPVQLEAIEGLRLGVESGIISRTRIMTSVQRVLKVKSECTSWAKALNPPGISLLSQLHPSHLALSKRAYDSSIAVIRNNEKLIPLSQSIHPQEEILLLTPLVKPLPASTLTKLESKHRHAPGSQNDVHERWSQAGRAGAIMTGEEVFRELGRSLARTRNGKLLHTSYTANGVRPVHENLINRASCVIIVTADANRNKYQSGFAKHVDMMCSMLRSRGQKKHLIVVAVSSPYDFAMDKTIGTYICTFDFTETAMHALVRTLFGKCPMAGTLPGTLRKTRSRIKSRQPWLVEPYDRQRDCHSLDKLIRSVARSSVELPTLEKFTSTAFHLPLCGASTAPGDSPSSDQMALSEAHFVVRNSSTGALYGFIATWTYPEASLGVIGALLVDPVKRNVSIGRSLHRRAVRSLSATGVSKVQLGTAFPAVFLGIPINSADADTESGAVHDWFAAAGWTVQFPTRLAILTIPSLAAWSAPDGLLASMQRAGLSFDLVHGVANADSVEAHISPCAGPDVIALYRAALTDSGCGVVRAKCGEAILGSVVFARAGSALANAFPLAPAGRGPRHGLSAGILAPVVSAGREQQALVLQGLALMGVRQSKANKCESVMLCLTMDDSEELLHAMGFENVQAYDSLTTSIECLTDN